MTATRLTIQQGHPQYHFMLHPALEAQMGLTPTRKKQLYKAIAETLENGGTVSSSSGAGLVEAMHWCQINERAYTIMHEPKAGWVLQLQPSREEPPNDAA